MASKQKRDPLVAIKTDLIEQVSYGPALASLLVRYKRLASSSSRPPAENTVVSLTSFPARLGKVHNCIRSLLAQTVRPAKIVLYLTKQECSTTTLPRRLVALQDAGLEIRMTDLNLRSFNKFFHAIQEFPDHDIVICDDDKLYPSDWLEGLLATKAKHPQQVICNRSRLVEFDDTGNLTPYRQWARGNPQRPSMSLLPLGVGGVLYPTKSLDERVSDSELYMRLSPTTDDLWLKAMAMLRGTKAVQVPGTTGLYPSIPFWNGQKLSPDNIWNGGNNNALTRIMQHFGLSAADFSEA